MKNPFLLDEAESPRPVIFRPGMGGPSGSPKTNTGAPKIGSTAPPQRPTQTKQHTSIMTRAARMVKRQSQMNQQAARKQAQAAKAQAKQKPATPATPATTESLLENLQIEANKAYHDALDKRDVDAMEAALRNPDMPFHVFAMRVHVRRMLTLAPFSADANQARLVKALLENPVLEMLALESPDFSFAAMLPEKFDLTRPRAWFGRPLKTWNFEPLANTPSIQLMQLDMYPMNVLHAFFKTGDTTNHFFTSVGELSGKISAGWLKHQFPGLATIHQILAAAR